MEKKQFEFNLVEHKQTQVNGVDVGIIRGYLATWDVDRGKDQFIRGCFSDSIKQHIEKNRQIRMKAYHRKVIGGMPIDKVYEDDKGLFVEGQINLGVKAGQEAYLLAKQGVLTDMSIGFSADEVTYEDGIRIITKATIWEGSIVDEPMNERANISEVKSINSRAVLPNQFADRARLWDAVQAEQRIREWADAMEEPNERYKNCFLYFDQENENQFGSYKLLICDVIDGQLKIVPRAVFAVRAVLSGARGGVDISPQDIEKCKSVVNALYAEMDLEKPFNGGKCRPFNLTEIKSVPAGLLNHILKKHELSRDASDYVTGCVMAMISTEHPHVEEIKDFISTINQIRENIKK